MKKVFTILLVVVFSAGLFAQNSQFKFSGPKKGNEIKKIPSAPTGAAAVKYPKPVHDGMGTKALAKIEMGMSVNPYTLLVPAQSSLDVNPGLNLISFTARTNSATYAGNRAGTYFSTDGGANFNSTSLEPWQIPVAGHSIRYPAGVIYNPAGNTDWENAFVIHTAPMLTDAAGSWGGSAFSSQQFNATNLDQQFTIYGTDLVNGYDITFPRDYLQARGDKFFVLANDLKDNGTYYTEFNTIVCKGVWNNTNNNVDWTYSLLQPDFALNTGTIPAQYGLPEGSYGAVIQMAADGQTGYIVFNGRNPDATDTLSYQPMVYKTTDGAQTWTKEVFNWETIPAIVTLIDSIGRVPRPMFTTAADGAIDNNGHLHFAAFINSAWSDHVDSLGYYAAFTNIKGFVYDMHQTTTGWDAFCVDTVWAQDAVDFPFPPDLDTYDERLQMGRSEDGSKIVYAFNDTDPAYDATNIFPDIIVRMHNVDDNLLSDRINITAGTEADADGFWMFLSETIIDDGGGLYTIPVSMSNHGGSDVDPVTHYYLHGIQIQAPAYPVSAGTVKYQNFDCQVYPNPSNDIVNIMVPNSGIYTVNVYNTVSKATASYTIDGNASIDLSNMPAGLYFLEIIGDNGKVVKKLIKK